MFVLEALVISQQKENFHSDFLQKTSITNKFVRKGLRNCNLPKECVI